MGGGGVDAGIDAGVDAGPGPCADGVLGTDAGETDVDCGGTCATCDVARHCVVHADCQTGRCENDYCVLVSANDAGEPSPTWRYVGLLDLGGGSTISSGRRGFVLARVGERFFIAGGHIIIKSNQVERVTNQLVTYDAPVASHPSPVTGASVFNPAMSFGRGSAWGGIGPGGGLWVMGGNGGNGTPITTSESYPAPDGGWEPRSAIPNNFVNAQTTQLPDGGLLVARGGDVLRVYDFDGGFPVVGPTLPPNADGLALGDDDTIYAFANDAMGRAVSRWKRDAGAFQVIGTAPTVRGPNQVSAVQGADGRFYVVGGAKTVVEAFTPGADFARVADTNEEHDIGRAMVGADGRIYVFFGYSGSPNNDYGYSMRIEAYGPTLDVSPVAGPRGVTAKLTGDNFAANAQVKLYWGNPDGGQLLKTTTSSATGTFTNVSVVVPASGNGPFFAVDSRARYPAFIPFTVQ